MLVVDVVVIMHCVNTDMNSDMFPVFSWYALQLRQSIPRDQSVSWNNKIRLDMVVLNLNFQYLYTLTVTPILVVKYSIHCVW